MRTQVNEELISAYLDGELTGDEQAQVEQALAENTALRQLFDDLRALRGNLQTLPRQRLARDLSADVIRRAEQTRQAPPPSQTPTPAAMPHVQVEPVRRTRLAKSNRHHLAMWLGMMIAASLLIAVLFIPRGDQLELARNDGQPGKGSLNTTEPAANGGKPFPDLHQPLASVPQDGNARLDPADLPHGMNVAEAEGSDGPARTTRPQPPIKQMPLSAGGNTKDARLRQLAQNVISRLDANEDGMISKEEAERDRVVKKIFEDIDQDGDGKLSAEEIYNYLESEASRPRR